MAYYSAALSTSGTAKIMSFNFKHGEVDIVQDYKRSEDFPYAHRYENRTLNNTSDQEKKYTVKFERPLGGTVSAIFNWGQLIPTSTHINFAHEIVGPMTEEVNIDGYRVKVSCNTSQNWTECV